MSKTRIYIFSIVCIFMLLYSCSNNRDRTLGQNTSDISTEVEVGIDSVTKQEVVSQARLTDSGIALSIEKMGSKNKIISFRYTLRNLSTDTIQVIRPELETYGHAGIFCLQSFFMENNKKDSTVIKYAKSHHKGTYTIALIDVGSLNLRKNSVVVIPPQAIYIDSLSADLKKTTYAYSSGNFELSYSLNFRNVYLVEEEDSYPYLAFAGAVASNRIEFRSWK